MRKGQKVLITGSNGYIGPILTKNLLNNGYEVVGLDTNYFDSDCELYPLKHNIPTIKKDMRDVNEDDLKNIDIICHLAALSNDPLGELDNNLTLDINYHASIKLAELAKNANVKKFIFSSSCSLYGITDSDEPVTEESELSPLTSYAKSKINTEKSLFQMKSDDFTVTSLRNSTAYGVSPKLRIDIVVNNLVGWAYTGGKIQIISDGSPWRPLIHIEDISKAFLAVIESKSDDVNGEAFNTGINEENYQIKDVARIIKKISPECSITIGDKSPDSRSYKVCFDKIMEYLPKFRPDWTVEKGVIELFEAYKKYSMDFEQFSGRYFTRLKQIRYLIDKKSLNKDLYWQH